MIDEDGTSLGQIDNLKAQQIASEKGLDLVEINPSSRPPVCKIMDFGKYKYDLAKRDKEQRSKQKEGELKEIRLTLKIGDHDLSYKAKKALGFFNQGNKVRVSMRLRGRENIFFNQAYEIFDKFADLAGLEFEQSPFKGGNIISATVGKIKENKDNNAQIKDS